MVVANKDDLDSRDHLEVHGTIRKARYGIFCRRNDQPGSAGEMKGELTATVSLEGVEAPREAPRQGQILGCIQVC
jgi:hypothetical protein